MKIVLASRNKHKIYELQALMSKYIADVEILSLDDVGIYGDIEENGENFCENAIIKARVAAASGYIGIGDDSGLSVRALDGEPGIYSARYAGEHGNDAANNTLLLKKLSKKEDRYAEFICTVALINPERDEVLVVEGKTGGIIIDEARGNGGFGYDPYFYYEPFGKTFAEMSTEEKNSVSHRGKAIEELARKIKDFI